MVTSHAAIIPAGARPLGLAECAVLGALSLGPAHGYDVFRFLDRNLGDVCRLGRSQTYAVLERLRRGGMVDQERVDQAGLPARKMCRLTRAGIETFSGWVLVPVPHVRDLRVEFLVKLFFAGFGLEGACDVLVHKQLRICEAEADRLQNLRRTASCLIEVRALEYRLAVVSASITWLKGLLERPSG